MNIETRKLTNRVRTGHQNNEPATNARHTCHHGNQNNAMGAMARLAKTGSASHSSERARISLEDSSSVNVIPGNLCSTSAVCPAVQARRPAPEAQAESAE